MVRTLLRLAVLLAAASLVAGAWSADAAVPRAAAGVRLPPGGGAVFDYQLGGAYAPAAGVRIVDRDRTDRPAPGAYNICYLNAFQTQPQERRWWVRHHANLLLRRANHYVSDPGWPGEYLLDTSTAGKRGAIAQIVGAWIDGCARSGYDAIEPDDLDSWTRAGVDGALTRADNLALATLLAARAHRDGLAIGQKNTVEVSRAGRTRVHFDFAVAEECQAYRECGQYRAVYGSRVYEVEYTVRAFRAACAGHRGTMSITLRDRDVVARGTAGYVDRHC